MEIGEASRSVELQSDPQNEEQSVRWRIRVYFQNDYPLPDHRFIYRLDRLLTEALRTDCRMLVENELLQYCECTDDLRIRVNVGYVWYDSPLDVTVECDWYPKAPRSDWKTIVEEIEYSLQVLTVSTFRNLAEQLQKNQK